MLPICKRLLENNVFRIVDVENATNFGRPVNECVATIPLHPNCRHSWLPYDEEIDAEVMGHHAQLAKAGLTDEDRLDELFDSSGQLREDAVLTDAEHDPMTWKTAPMEPAAELLAAVAYTRRVAKVDVDDEHTREVLPTEQLRPALHQRAIDSDEAVAYQQRMAQGESAPPIEVHRWPDGRLGIENGQPARGPRA